MEEEEDRPSLRRRSSLGGEHAHLALAQGEVPDGPYLQGRRASLDGGTIANGGVPRHLVYGRDEGSIGVVEGDILGQELGQHLGVDRLVHSSGFNVRHGVSYGDEDRCL